MEFTREQLNRSYSSWCSERTIPTFDDLAAFATRLLDRAEKAEGWSLHWKFEAERLQRELDLANWQHANREAPAEHNPEMIVGDLPNPSGSGSGGAGVSFVSIHPLPENPPSVTTVGEFIPGELFESGPQRPHESLVWAIYHSVYVQKCSEAAARDLANDCVERWHRRWPEDREP